MSDRSGKAYVKNSWGLDLAQVTLRHRRGNDPSKQEEQSWYNVTQGTEVEPLEITYSLGLGSPEDYWWIKFSTMSGQEYSCKNSFYCSLSSDDDGNVHISLNGDTQEMTVTFSSSSGCEVKLNKN